MIYGRDVNFLTCPFFSCIVKWNIFWDECAIENVFCVGLSAVSCFILIFYVEKYNYFWGVSGETFCVWLDHATPNECSVQLRNWDVSRLRRRDGGKGGTEGGGRYGWTRCAKDLQCCAGHMEDAISGL